MSATYTGMNDMAFVMGDDVSWTVTVSVPGVTDLSTWTIRLLFANEDDPTDTFSKTEADTDWIGSVSGVTFVVLVDSTPTSIDTSGGNYNVKCAIESGTTRHVIGSKDGVQWKFKLPSGAGFPDL